VRLAIIIAISAAGYYCGSLAGSYIAGRRGDEGSFGFWEAVLWPFYLPIALVDWSYERGVDCRLSKRDFEE
jgi:hypothetical protein